MTVCAIKDRNLRTASNHPWVTGVQAATADIRFASGLRIHSRKHLKMKKHLLLLIVLIFVQHSSSAPHTECPLHKTRNEVKVFITISSLVVSATDRGVVKRQLELNWIAPNPKPGDSIGLYDRDPLHHPHAKPLHALDPTQHKGGYFRSDVDIPVQIFKLSCLAKNPCLGYWIAYISKEGSVLASSCLQLRPFWMGDNYRYLRSLRLTEVMIPGSHDSGSFSFRRLNTPLSRFEYAQEEPLFNQLAYGLRYFDFRVGYYPNTRDQYYINHNFLRTEHSVSSILGQVLDFVQATKEVVILDFHNFPVGFKRDSIHVGLIQLIVDTFGPLLVPSANPDITFQDLWASNQRVLVSYDSKVRSRAHSDVLWPAIARAWGNKQDPEQLRKYFLQVFGGPVPRGLWASMAELTPDTRSIVLHPDTGLRALAQEINRNVTHWFRDLYWQKANIVATDYFLGNNIIDVAIETNKLKALCPRKMWLS